MSITRITHSNFKALTSNGGMFCLVNTGTSDILVQDSTITPTTAYLNGGVGYAVNSEITLRFLNLVVNTPQALNERGGMLYLNSFSGITRMTINFVTINDPSALISGGVIYLTGVHGILNSDTLVVNRANAYTGDGGCYHF